MRPSLFLTAFAVALAAATGPSSTSTLPTTAEATAEARPQAENDGVVEAAADEPLAAGATEAGQLSPDEILTIKEAKAEEAAEVWRNREQEAEENRNQRERARLGIDPPPVPVHESTYVVEKFVTAEVAAETEEQVYLAQEAGLTEITEVGQPVVVEISVDLAQALFEEGLQVEIIERFLQFEISPGEDETGNQDDGDDKGGGDRVCTEYAYGENLSDVDIPDDPDECNGGETGYAWTGVSISGYSGYTVCNVGYRMQVVHTWPGDLVIQLNNDYHSVGSGDTVWNRLGGSTDGGYDDDAESDDDIYLNWRTTSFFNGDPVDGGWYVDVWDHCPADTGYIDYVQFRIYYETAAPDYVVTAPYTSPTRNTCGAGNDCGLTSAEDHNYQVTIPSSGLWHFSLCDSDFDTWLAVGTSLCSSDIGYNDDACGGTVQSELTVDISAGTYYVYVAGYTSGFCGNYVLDISRVVTPDYVVTAPYTSPMRNTCGAGDDCDISYSDNEDHIYQVSIPQAGSWTFSLCDSAYDTKLAVGTTICGEEVGYNDDACGVQSEITASISAGTYYVVVDGYSTYCGDYILDIFRAVDYTVTAPYRSPTRNTCGAGNDCNLTASADHNYRVTIPNSGLWRFSLCESNYDTWLAVGTSFCSADIGFNDDACGGMVQSELTVDITAGTYYVYVGGYSTYCGDYVLNIAEQAPWTVMIYLDGDNNLEQAGITDFLEMAQVNNPDVNIVVQFDRVSGHSTDYGDWTTCKRFLVTNGMTPTAANQLMDIGEVNMGAAATLVDFIDWARADYPAENYALILWNHGDGWRDPTGISPLFKGICSDDTSGDQLEMSELNQALNSATNGGAIPIHVIDMDACLMAGLEVAYELIVYGYAHFFAGSAELVPGDGNEYQDILAAANLSSTTTPQAWASYLVTAYQTAYDGWDSRQTYMAASLGEINSLALDVSNLATLLRNNMSTERAHIQNAWTLSRHYTDNVAYPWIYQSFIDLHDFCFNLRQQSSNAAIDDQCQVVMNTLTGGTLINHWADSAYGGTTANQRCFWIYFPASTAEPGWNDYNGTFLSFLYPNNQYWDEFLDDWFSYMPPNDYCANAIPIYDGDTVFDTTVATTDGPSHSECQFDGQTYHDIWYEYVATCTGNLTVSTCNQAEYDTDLVVYDGCNCGNLVLLGCNDDMSGCSGYTSELTVPVLSGNCYLIRVGGYVSGSMGPGTVTVTCVPEPDYYVTAPYISPTRNTCGAGDDCDLNGPDNEDHIYEVYIPYAGNWTFSLCESAYDTKLAIGTTICGADIGYNDDACGVQSEYTANIAAGTYYVVVDGYSVYCGDYVLNIWRQPVDFAVTAPYTSPTRTTCGAVNDCGLRPSEEHLYEVTIPSSGLWTFSLCGSGYDTWLAVGTRPCTSDVGYNDDFCGLQSQLTVNVSAGNYYVAVEGYSSSDCGNYILDIWPEQSCTIECPGGSDLEGEPCGADTNGGCNMATPQFEPIACDGTVCGTIWADGGTRDTDWFEVVASADGSMTWTVEAEFTVVLGLIEQIVPGQPGCDNITGYLDPYAMAGECEQMSVTFPVSAGGTYYLFVSHQDLYDWPCDSNNDYVATLTCEGQPECPGDLDHDGDVDLADLAQLLGHYGMTSGATYEDGDLDGDGDVDLADLAGLLAHYGEVCW